jgi:hypothetical protein
MRRVAARIRDLWPKVRQVSYRRADQSWPGANVRMDAMLGEGLLWAHARLLRRCEPRKVTVNERIGLSRICRRRAALPARRSIQL